MIDAITGTNVGSKFGHIAGFSCYFARYIVGSDHDGGGDGDVHGVISCGIVLYSELANDVGSVAGATITCYTFLQLYLRFHRSSHLHLHLLGYTLGPLLSPHPRNLRLLHPHRHQYHDRHFAHINLT